MNNLSISEIKDIIKNNKYVIVYVGAKWCKSCNIIKPQINNLLNIINCQVSYIQLDYDTIQDDIELDTICSINHLPHLSFFKLEEKINNIETSDFNIISKEIYTFLDYLDNTTLVEDF